jgi:predicted 3-demethylubiquinone-9 3-methyltransferase (glyoxalase superfamily)
MKKITPCLWFDQNAEEAANFYVSVFKNSKIISKVENTAENPSQTPVGSVLVVNFQLNGEEFMALNGGPFFKFSEAVSFVVKCKDQEEIDYYWEKLSAVPEAEQCGWLKDKFGLSWQIVPENMGELVKTEKSMQAMLSMKKIIIKDLENAA